MRKTILVTAVRKLPVATAAIILAASPALAGGEPYYMPPQYPEAPPVTGAIFGPPQVPLVPDGGGGLVPFSRYDPVTGQFLPPSYAPPFAFSGRAKTK